MNIEQIMTRNPVVISPQTTVGKAVELMLEKNFRHLPILEGSQLVGMISDRDVREVALGTAIARGDVDAFQEQCARPVSDVMSGGVVSAAMESTIAEVAELMLEEGVGAVPVIETHSDTLVGMVSYVDILRHIAGKEE